MPVITMPASGNESGSQGERLLAARCIAGPVSDGLGPTVAIWSVTLVVPCPAAIVDGLKVQLLLVSVGSAGLKEQLSCMGREKVVAGAIGERLNS